GGARLKGLSAGPVGSLPSRRVDWQKLPAVLEKMLARLQTLSYRVAPPSTFGTFAAHDNSTTGRHEDRPQLSKDAAYEPAFSLLPPRRCRGRRAPSALVR